MPLKTPATLVDDPHLVASGFFQTGWHATEGRVRTMAVPSTWSASQPTLSRLAPRLGEHSREVLSELGYPSTEVDTLMLEGVLREPDGVSPGLFEDAVVAH